MNFKKNTTDKRYAPASFRRIGRLIATDLKNNMFEIRWHDVKYGIGLGILYLLVTSALLIGFDYQLKFVREWVSGSNFFEAGSKVIVTSPFPNLFPNNFFATIYDTVSPAFLMFAVFGSPYIFYDTPLSIARVQAIFLAPLVGMIGYCYVVGSGNAFDYFIIFVAIFIASFAVYGKQLINTDSGEKP